MPRSSLRVSAFVSSAAAWGVTFTIDPTLSSRVISPWIDGLNGPIGGLNLTYERAIVGPRTVTYYEDVRKASPLPVYSPEVQL